MKPSAALHAHRDAIRRIVESHHAGDARVFGSVSVAKCDLDLGPDHGTLDWYIKEYNLMVKQIDSKLPVAKQLELLCTRPARRCAKQRRQR